jgi:hypothetical protein
LQRGVCRIKGFAEPPLPSRGGVERSWGWVVVSYLSSHTETPCRGHPAPTSVHCACQAHTLRRRLRLRFRLRWSLLFSLQTFDSRSLTKKKRWKSCVYQPRRKRIRQPLKLSLNLNLNRNLNLNLPEATKLGEPRRWLKFPPLTHRGTGLRFRLRFRLRLSLLFSLLSFVSRKV